MCLATDWFILRERRRWAEELFWGWECHNNIFIPSTHYWVFAWESWGQQRRRGRRLAEEGLLRAIHLSWTCTWLSLVWLMALLAPPSLSITPKQQHNAAKCHRAIQAPKATAMSGVEGTRVEGEGSRVTWFGVWGRPVTVLHLRSHHFIITLAPPPNLIIPRHTQWNHLPSLPAPSTFSPFHLNLGVTFPCHPITQTSPLSLCRQHAQPFILSLFGDVCVGWFTGADPDPSHTLHPNTPSPSCPPKTQQNTPVALELECAQLWNWEFVTFHRMWWPHEAIIINCCLAFWPFPHLSPFSCSSGHHYHPAGEFICFSVLSCANVRPHTEDFKNSKGLPHKHIRSTNSKLRRLYIVYKYRSARYIVIIIRLLLQIWGHGSTTQHILVLFQFVLRMKRRILREELYFIPIFISSVTNYQMAIRV